MKFRIKSPRYIEKYVLSKHGAVLTANFDTTAGQYLCLLIQNQPNARKIRLKAGGKPEYVEKKDLRLPSEYDAEISVCIPDSKVLRGMNHIRNDTMMRFVSKFQDEFVQEFIDMMEGLEVFRIPIVARIEMFCGQYGLCEDDIKFETLKKIYYRHRARSGGAIRPKKKSYADSEF